jgi:Tape measure protein
MASNRIFLEVKFESQDAERDITRINQNIKNIGSNSEDATKKAASGMKSFSVAVDQTTSSIAGMTQALVGLGIAQAARLMASMADEVARVRRSFESIAGGAEAFKLITTVAKTASYDLAEFAKSANELKNAGVGMEKLPGLMQALANATAAAGNTQMELADAVKEVAKEMATGFVSARSLVRLSQEGFRPMAQVMKQLGISATEARTEITKIPVDQILNALVKIGQSHPGAAATESMKQLSAQSNRLKNDLTELGTVIGENFGKQLLLLANSVDSVLKHLIELVKLLGQMPESLKNTITMVVEAGTAFAFLFGAFKTLNAGWELVVKGAGKFSTALKFMKNAVSVVAAQAELLALKLGIVEEAAAIGTVAGWGTKLIPVLGILTTIAAVVYAIYRWYKAINEERDKSKDIPKLPTNDDPFQPVPDANEMARLMMSAQNLVSEAMKRNKNIGLESIAALTYAYEEHYRELAKNDKAVAVARKAYIIDVQTELLKRQEEVRKNTLKFFEEAAVMERKIAVARQDVIPDDTVAGQRERLEVARQAFQDETNIRRDAAIAEAQRVTNLQKQAIRDSTLDEFKKREQLAGWDQTMITTKTQLEKKAIDEIQLHNLETTGRVNQLIIEQEKQLREEAAQDEISRINQNASLVQARIQTKRPELLSERMDVIDQAYQNEIKRIEDVRQANENALKANYEAYQKLHPTGAGLIEEYNKFLREYTRLNYQADTDIQMARYDAWKAGDEAILNEQKRIYEGLKTQVDKVFDALFDKSKSIWSSIASAFKTAIMGAIKEIVTSRIAGALMSMLGYGTVSYRGPIWNQIPFFSGAGQPPEGEGTHSQFRIPPVYPPFYIPTAPPAPPVSGAPTVSSQGGADRMMADTLNSLAGDAVAEQRALTGTGNRTANQVITDAQITSDMASGAAVPVATGVNGGTIYAQLPPMARQQATGARGSMAANMAKLKDSMNIGKPITLPNGSTVPWSSATATQRLTSVLKSPAVATLAASVGLPVMMSGLRRGGVLGDTMAVGGGILAGAGLASMFGMNPIAGAMVGGGVGLVGAGWRRGGAVGLGMDVLGGASAGAGIGFMLGSTFGGPLGAAAGTVIGAGVGAVVGAGIGIARLFIHTKDEQLRGEIKRVYGIDIPNANIRKQILDIIDQKYGGNMNLGIYSQDVQELVRLYSLTQGQTLSGLPRPMYAATFAQTGGNLALQPVYSGGQQVQNPYTGITTTQWSQMNSAAAGSGVYIQLHPQQANDLFTGKVVNVLNRNPATVAAANSNATRSGTERVAQRGALMEPLTVMR